MSQFVAVELSSHFAFGAPDFLFLMRVCRKASAVALGGKHIFYSPVCVQRVGSAGLHPDRFSVFRVRYLPFWLLDLVILPAGFQS